MKRKAIQPRVGKQEEIKTIIVRNLAFKCTTENLKYGFSHCGKILSIMIPEFPGKPGVRKGFATIIFKEPEFAKKAVETMNGKSILGRTISVDLALPREQYAKVKEMQQEEQWNTEIEKETPKRIFIKGKGGMNAEDSEDDDNEKDNDNEKDENTKEKLDIEEYSDHDKQQKEEKEKEENEKIKKQKKQKSQQVTALDAKIDEGKAIFIRNMSFDTTEEGLRAKFTPFGEISKVFIVSNPITGQSKGSAFIYFTEQASAKAAVYEAYKSIVQINKKKEDMPSNITLDTRQLIVAIAVSKKQVKNEMEARHPAKEQDKRNLYLAQEGVITRDSPVAKGISEADLEKRERYYREKVAKLKDPNFSVSTTRLCVRNLSKTTTKEELKKNI